MNLLCLKKFLIVGSLAFTPAGYSTVRTVNNGQLVLDGVPEIPGSIKEAVESYQNVRSANVNGFTPDGKGLWITTRFAAVSQLHSVASPGAARTQRTFLNEPIRSVKVSPNLQRIVFAQDRGGNEDYQLYTLNPSSGKTTRVTTAKARYDSPLWSPDSKSLLYVSNQRNGMEKDIWRRDFVNGQWTKERLVLKASDNFFWSPQSFSPDADKVIINHYISSTASNVYLLDLRKGTKRALKRTKDGSARYLGYDFSADGRYMFYSSDENSQFRQLRRLDLRTGADRLITQRLGWDVNGFVMSPDRSKAYFMTNENGLSKLYRLQLDDLSYDTIDSVPRGVISGLKFHPDNKLLAFSLNTPTSPTDAYTLNTTSEDAQPIRWTYSEVGGLNPEQFVEPKFINYPTFDKVDGKNREIPAFVYQPKTKGPHPVIIQIHGGPEAQARPYFSSTLQMFAQELGAAVIVPNVRGSAGYGKNYLKLDNGFLREDSVKDIGALLDWIATQNDFDASRVLVAGGSYGGYMSLATAVYYSDRLIGAVDIVGISSFTTFLKNTRGYRRDARRVEYGDERDPKMKAFLDKISPLNLVDKISIPFLVIQGENDPRVPASEARQIVKALRNRNIQTWFVNGLNEGHGFRRKENREVAAEVTMMFYKDLISRKGSISEKARKKELN